jgi:hypothetical protein
MEQHMKCQRLHNTALLKETGRHASEVQSEKGTCLDDKIEVTEVVVRGSGRVGAVDLLAINYSPGANED